MVSLGPVNWKGFGVRKLSFLYFMKYKNIKREPAAIFKPPGENKPLGLKMFFERWNCWI